MTKASAFAEALSFLNRQLGIVSYWILFMSPL